MAVEDGAALGPRTTLELGGAARHLLRVDRDALAVEGLRWARQQGMQVAVLGGGSNVVIADAGWDGLVLLMAQRGVELRELADGRTRVEVCAGEAWDDVVALCVERGLSGLECLSGIPGSCGATPIQNVGAYGQEVADTIESVTVLDRDALQIETWPAARCGFGYRDSGFKRQPDRFLVLKLSFLLQRGALREPRYAELRAALAASTAAAEPRHVREVVLQLRRGKSMVLDAGDENRRSVGSFFTNPVVEASEAQRVVELAIERGWVALAAEVPRYVQPDGRVKLAAAWLLERAGVRKGERAGHFGVSSRHALAIVHHGGGRSDELVSFARGLRERVWTGLGVELVPEPVFVGFGERFRF